MKTPEGVHWWGAAALLLVAVLLRWWAAPVFERLPADYSAEVKYTAKWQAHQTPSSPAEDLEAIVRRRDQTMVTSDGHSIIQGDTHWSTPAGMVMFEITNLYAVDRRSRQNVAGFGDRDRTGHYLFPPHTARQACGLWDPNYSGPCAVTFDRTEQFHGLEVAVFNYVADGLDESESYEALPDVPEKYRAITYGKGRLRVEPVSGVIVDYEDGGVSYFVEPKTGAHVGEPIDRWTKRYTPETIEAQVRRAVVARRWMLALEVWLPLTLAAAGMVWIAAACLRSKGGPR